VLTVYFKSKLPLATSFTLSPQPRMYSLPWKCVTVNTYRICAS
jgi:hypothetical protein